MKAERCDSLPIGKGKKVKLLKSFRRDEVTLTSHPLLDKICGTIRSSRLEWTETYREHIASLQKIDRSTLPGTIAEMHVLDLLIKAEIRTNGVIGVNPIPTDATTQSFVFRRDNKDVNHIRVDYSDPAIDDGSMSFVEYDGVMIVGKTENTDGLPVIVEIKNTKNPQELGFALTEERVKQVILPLREYYKTDKLGYIIVANPASLSSRSQKQSSFVHDGGILVPMPRATIRDIDEKTNQLCTETIMPLLTA